ncbi:hypothetical protein [Aestuariivirga sp.]|uniref:DUF7507 domain-containing protein n=1 Tax=Aestuariivirga sp. TaxID=2650926 RepID=UPI0035945719
MQKITVLNIRGLSLSCSRLSLAAIASAASLTGLTTYAYAAGSIDNSAIASGNYGGNAVPSQPSTATVPLADPSLQLIVLKTGVLNDGGNGLDAGETITYTVQVTNDSNVTVTNVTPSEDNIQFGATAGGGTFGAFSPLNAATLAPGASTSFTIDYTVTAEDIYRAAALTDGVQNTVDIAATGPNATPVTGTDTSQNTIPADPGLSVVKTASLVDSNGNNLADIGEVINYEYVVTNSGNVAIDDVAINDTHEGTLIGAGLILEVATTLADGPLATSADPSQTGAADGTWDLLGPGAAVTFRYAHTVTQTEFEAQ